MEEAVAGAASGWGHLPWLAARLVGGLVLVFAVLPVPWSLYYLRPVVVPNFPLLVFVRYWSWIASDINHLWTALVASAVVGLFADDFIEAWNAVFIKLLRWTRVYKRIKGWTVELLEGMFPAQASEWVRLVVPYARLNEVKEKARFRVWLIGNQNGAAMRYLDWHGFNVTLSRITADAFLLLAQAWVVWGVIEFCGALWAGAVGDWCSLTGAGAFLEWLGMLLFLVGLAWAASVRFGLWRRIEAHTWDDLYGVWEDELRRGQGQ